MGIFDKLKKKKEPVAASLAVSPAAEAKPVAAKKVAVTPTKDGALKGKSTQAYRVLVKPLITEKASAMGAAGKYVFSVNPTMNKIEVKKAIRAVYNVNPVSVRIITVSGKQVRYGR